MWCDLGKICVMEVLIDFFGVSGENLVDVVILVGDVVFVFLVGCIVVGVLIIVE